MVFAKSQADSVREERDRLWEAWNERRLATEREGRPFTEPTPSRNDKMMPKVSPTTLREVREALRRYERIVAASPMRESTKKTYLLHSNNFVRWLADDFEPGASVGRR